MAKDERRNAAEDEPRASEDDPGAPEGEPGAPEEAEQRQGGTPEEAEQPAGDAETPPEQADAPDEAPEQAEAVPEQVEPPEQAETSEQAEAPATAEQRPPAEGRERRGRGGRQRAQEGAEEVIPGAHLEPDLVLEDEGAEAAAEPRAEYRVEEPVEAPTEPDEPDEPEAVEPEPKPVARQPMDLAADARYAATGKRKRSVARVILKPGTGAFAVNGRELAEFFPRPTLQRVARQALETAGYESRMDVVARIHGGGVSSQAGALRHGVARALVEADPNLRGELKRRGFLTRDPRVKERKKAGLKKARKRPQFSKR